MQGVLSKVIHTIRFFSFNDLFLCEYVHVMCYVMCFYLLRLMLCIHSEIREDFIDGARDGLF